MLTNLSYPLLKANFMNLLVEQIGQDYIHNMSGEKFLRVLKQGSLSAYPQKDAASLNAHKRVPELCLSRGDAIPQKTGLAPSNDLGLGKMVKVVIKPESLQTLGIKKPYPVNFQYFKNNRDLENDLIDAIKEAKTEKAKFIFNQVLNNIKNHKRANKVGGNTWSESKMISMLKAAVEWEKKVYGDDKLKYVLNTFSNTREYGESRIAMKKPIPINSKYMEIFIPDNYYNSLMIKNSLANFQYVYRVSDQEMEKLFKPYKDTSRDRYRKIHDSKSNSPLPKQIMNAEKYLKLKKSEKI